jgi:hypothetical protein
MKLGEGKPTVICVPWFPPTGFGSAFCPGFGGASLESEYFALDLINWLHTDNSTVSTYLQAQFESLVLVVTVR